MAKRTKGIIPVVRKLLQEAVKSGRLRTQSRKRMSLMKVKLKLKIKGRWWLRLSSKCSKLMITPLYLRKLRLNKSPSQSRRTKVLPPKQSPNNYQTPSRTCLRLKDNPT